MTDNPSIDVLEISVRATAVLRGAGIETAADIERIGLQGLLAMKDLPRRQARDVWAETQAWLASNQTNAKEPVMQRTHTLATLELSPDAYAEARDALVVAGYDHAVLTEDDGEMLEMTGIALVRAIEPATTEDWHWYFGVGTEPDGFIRASANTRDAALAGALDALDLDTDERCVTLCQGLPEKLHDEVLGANDVVEAWCEANADAADEDDNLSMEPSEEQQTELRAMLGATIAKWRKRHGLGRAFALQTRGAEVVQVADDGTVAEQGAA